MNDIGTQEQHIAQIFRIIQVHQEIINDLGSFRLDVNIRFDAHFVQGRNGAATRNDDGFVFVLFYDSNGIIQRRTIGDDENRGSLILNREWSSTA